MGKLSKSVHLTPLAVIASEKGAVLHAMKSTEQDFTTFGEAYFSRVDARAVKGWKRHRRMTLNLVVISGEMKIVVIDPHDRRTEYGLGIEPSCYARLTVPPMHWVAFGAVGDETAMLLNLANIPHDPEEADSMPIDTFLW